MASAINDSKKFPRLRERLPVPACKVNGELEERGFVVLRNFMPDRDTLRAWEEQVWPLANYPSDNNDSTHKAWSYNRGIAEMVRHQPFAAAAVDLACGGQDAFTLTVDEAPAWGTKAASDGASGPGQGDAYQGPWHVDLRGANNETHGEPLLSVWIALTDAPYAIEFVPGSNLVYPFLRDTCAFPHTRVPNFKLYEHSCVMQHMRLLTHGSNISRVVHSFDMRAGDAIFFTGVVLHRTRTIQQPRLAVALRYHFHEQGRTRCRLYIVGTGCIWYSGLAFD